MLAFDLIPGVLFNHELFQSMLDNPSSNTSWSGIQPEFNSISSLRSSCELLYIYINCKYDRYTHMNSESSFINGGWYWLVNLPAGPPGGRTRPSTELDDLARVTLLSNQAGVAYGNLGEVACSSLHKKFLLILKLLAVLAVTSGIWLVSLEACSSQVKVL